MTFEEIAKRVSNYNRNRKYDFFINYFRPSLDTTILDVAAAEEEYHQTTNILEKRYPHPEKITVLGVEDYRKFSKRCPKVRIVRYGGDSFPFKDETFDICWSNAVTEHVGNRNKQKTFLSEINRVANKVFFTTPNRYFPFEVHSKVFSLHYFPKSIFDKILKKLDKAWASGDYMFLLSLRDIKAILKQCNITEYEVIKNKFILFTVHFMVILK